MTLNMALLRTLSKSLCAASLLFAVPTHADDVGLDAIVHRFMRDFQIVGLTLAIGREGEVEYSQGYGLRSEGDDLYSNARMPIGSISKQFTASLFLSAIDHGQTLADGTRLSLELTLRDVGENSLWTRDCVDASLPDAYCDLTMRDLLTMSSGIPDFVGPAIQSRHIYRDDRDLLEQDVFRAIRSTRHIGSFEYSNTNYFLLKEIMEENFDTDEMMGSDILHRGNIIEDHFDDRRYWSYLKSRHLSRLGINGYCGRNEVEYFNESWAIGAGDMFLSAEELIAWNVALTDGLILSDESYDEILDPQLEAGIGRDYGMGWFIDTPRAGYVRYYHEGAISGFTSINTIVYNDTADEFYYATILSNRDTVTCRNNKPDFLGLAEVALTYWLNAHPDGDPL